MRGHDPHLGQDAALDAPEQGDALVVVLAQQHDAREIERGSSGLGTLRLRERHRASRRIAGRGGLAAHQGDPREVEIGQRLAFGRQFGKRRFELAQARHVILGGQPGRHGHEPVAEIVGEDRGVIAPDVLTRKEREFVERATVPQHEDLSA